MSVKLRLIPVLFIKNGLIVRSERFSTHQIIGNVVNEAHRYNEWNVDELIYINISQTNEFDLRRDDHKVASYSGIEEVMDRISSVCFMPLTFGGGIRTQSQIDFFIRNGADKVVLNSAFHECPELIEEASQRYGAQCVVASVDYRIIDGKPIAFVDSGRKTTGKLVWEWVQHCEDLGAGEIFLNSIDRDGMGCGYDSSVIKQVVASTSLPVIACGGAGDIADFVELANEVDLSGIAAGNIFHFTERSYPRAKNNMKKAGINVR